MYRPLKISINSINSILVLLRYQNIIPNQSIKCTELFLSASSSNRFRTKYYYYQDVRENPVIYLQHGMNTHGIEDPRIIELAKSIASCGYVVVTPELSEIKELNLSQLSETIKHIKICFELIVEKFQRKVGYISACVLAGLGLIALSDKSIQRNLSSMMIIGAYSHIEYAFRHLIKNLAVDSYGANIIFFNYLKLIFPQHKNLENLFFEAASIDLNLITEKQKINDLYIQKKLSQEEINIVEKIITDLEFRKFLEESICKKLFKFDNDKYSPIAHIQKIESPISILHGKNDPIFSFEDSKKLYKQLENRNTKTSLSLSSLVTHDGISAKRFLSDVVGIFPVINAFFHFLYYLEN